MYTYIVTINPTNKYRNHKSSMCVTYRFVTLNVTYRRKDNYIYIYDVKVADYYQKSTVGGGGGGV